MSYPPYGGGYPPQQPGYPGGPGYPQPGGGYPPPGGVGGMPTPESASAAAYGGAGGGMPYAPQPGGPGGIGFGTGGPMPPGPGGYPPAPMGMPGAQPSYPAQPGYPPQPAPGYPPQPGYPGQAPPPGGYGGAAQPYGQPPQGGVPQYGAPPAGGYGAPQPGGYGAPPAPQQMGYGAPPQGQGYGAPPGQAPPGGYGAPPTSQPGYGAPPTSQPGYGAPPGGYGNGAPQANYGGYGNPQGAPSAAPAASKYKVYEEGTLKPSPNFRADNDAEVLRKAMKGFGTDEQAIINVLGHRTNQQRQEIKLMFKTCYGKDLIKELKSELSSNFEDAILALLMTPEEFDAYELKRAMRGLGTDEAALIEILCTRNNAQIHNITATYKRMYGRNLEQDLVSETSGHFKRLLVSMSTGNRMENQSVDMNKANTDAQRLYQAGEKRWGTDESAFNMVLATQSYEQCRAVFDAYSQVSKRDIEQAIRSEMSGDISSGLTTIVKMIRNKHFYFAERLYYSMKGAGTDDRTLIRVISSRCEVDMKQIKAEFMRSYGKTLESFVSGDVSGDYKRLMITLIQG